MQLTTQLKTGMRRVRPLVLIVIALAAAFYFLIPHYFWTRAKPVPGGFNVLSDKSESALSADGQTLIIAREVENRGSDLYVLRREGKTWGLPKPLIAVNTPFNETDPELSHDGRFLLMASDRPGGGGGYDLWIARWDESASTWRRPLNLGWGVNSRFDEFGPTVTHATNRIYFSSNRPEGRLSFNEKNQTDKELRREFPPKDLDVYYADNIGETIGKPVTVYALRDRRQLDEDLATRLGGSPGTEAAVKRALVWLAANQEADGRWAIGRHGGQAGHDIASTALTLLALMGRGHKHTEPGPYREHVDKGLKWLVKSTRPNGDMRSGNVNNGMYDQGMGTMTLAEAYGLTKDESLRQSSQAAVNFVVAAQHKPSGGWRYKPGQAGDMSVFGWQVMAIHNAINAGLEVPPETLVRAEQWLTSVGTGKNGGLYGYQRGGQQPAMVAEGMFCRQLLRSPRNSLRMNETAAFIEQIDPNKHGQSFYYFIYYSTLGLYHHDIDYWETWNRELKNLLLDSQVKSGDLKGSWPIRGAHGPSMGRVLCTAFATLSLEIYYRYLPRYEFLEPEMADIMTPGASPAGEGRKSTQATNQETVVVLASESNTNSLVIPLFGAAWSLAEVNTAAHEAQPAISGDGKTLFFASGQEKGKGGADLYVARMGGEGFGKTRALRGYLNSSADETDPTIAADGVTILMSSNRESPSGARYRLYRAEYRRVTPMTFVRNVFLYVLSLLERIKWWLLVLLLVIAGIIYLAKQFADPRMRERYNLLQKCILGSILAHLLILLLTAFWKISTEVVSPTDERLEIAIDVNALAQEALALDIREDISELPEAESVTLAEQMEAPVPVQEIETLESKVEPIEVEKSKEVLALEAPELESPPEVVEIDLPEPDVVLANADMMETAFELEEAPIATAAEQESPEAPKQETIAKPIESIPESQPETVEITTEAVKPPPDLVRMEMTPEEVAKELALPELLKTPDLKQTIAMQLPEMEVLDAKPPEPQDAPEIEQMARRAEQPDAPDVDAQPVDAPLPSPPAEPEAIARTKALLAKLLEEADLTTDVEPVPLEYTNLAQVAIMPTMQMEEGKPAEVEQVASAEPQPRTARARPLEPVRVKMEHGEEDRAELPSAERRDDIPDSVTPFSQQVVEESHPPVETLTDTAMAMAPKATPIELQIDMERKKPAARAGRVNDAAVPSPQLASLPRDTDVFHGARESTMTSVTSVRSPAREMALVHGRSVSEAETDLSHSLLENTLAMVRAERPAQAKLEMETPGRRASRPDQTRNMPPGVKVVAKPAALATDRGKAETEPAVIGATMPAEAALRRGAVSLPREIQESSRESATLTPSDVAPLKALQLASVPVAMEEAKTSSHAVQRREPSRMATAGAQVERVRDAPTEVGRATHSPVQLSAVAAAVEVLKHSSTTPRIEAGSPTAVPLVARPVPRLHRDGPATVEIAMESVRPDGGMKGTVTDRMPKPKPGTKATLRATHTRGMAGVKVETAAISVASGSVQGRGRRVSNAQPIEGRTSSMAGLARVSASPMAVTRPAPISFQLEARQAREATDSGSRGDLIAMSTAGHVLPAPSQHLRGRAGRAEMIRAGIKTESLARASRAIRSGALQPVEGHTSQPGIAHIAFAGNPDVPVTEILEDLILDAAPATLQPYYLREPGKRGTVINRLGGGSDTEAAVRLALNWFTTTQEIDGRWSITRFGGQRGHDAGATGFVLLSYLGWGAKHTENGPYQEPLVRGLDWLKTKMKKDGDLRETDAENAMYSQGIATLALAEAFALTKDEKLREPAQRAINFIVAAQNEKDGSWRYHPGDPGDTSVLGWQLMALTSARLAGLEVPEDAFEKVSRWLRRVGGGEHGGLYGYRNNAAVPAMVAEGMFCRQLLGTTPDSSIMKESAFHISSTPVDLESKTLPVYYYTYYGTLAMHQHQGPAWHSWNDNVKRSLLSSQDRDGDDKGSWEPKGLYADRTGRLVTTAMATLTLEVYYRYLPLYTFADSPDAK